MPTIRFKSNARAIVYTREIKSESEIPLCLNGATNERTSNEETRNRPVHGLDCNNIFHFVWLCVRPRSRLCGALVFSAFSQVCVCVCVVRVWRAGQSRWKRAILLFVSIFLQAYRCERHLSLWRRCREWTQGAPLLRMKMNNILILIYALGWVNAFSAYTNRACSGQRFSCDQIFSGKVQSMIGRSFLIYQTREFNKMLIVCINNDTLIINNRECAAHNSIKVFHGVIVCARTSQFS